MTDRIDQVGAIHRIEMEISDAAVAAEPVLDLVDRGVTDFHFYTMNRADLVYAVCHLLGLRPSHTTNHPGSAASLPFAEKVREVG